MPSLKRFNTFGMDVDAKYIYEIYDFAQFSMVFQLINQKKLPFVVLGEGSDVLFTKDFDGVVIINKLKGIEVNEDLDYYYVKLQAGEKLHDVIKNLMNRKIYGLENLALIPGTAGAAPIQNVGAYGSSFSDFCRYVEVLDLEHKKLDRIWAKDCGFGYRTSIFKNKENINRYIITAVELKLPKAYTLNTTYKAFENIKIETPEELFEAVCSIRKAKLPDPKEIGNAGSFFKNPIISKEQLKKISKEYPNVVYYPTQDENKFKVAAGWLIDKAGCKGMTLGNAGTYDKQALVIVNLNQATPNEILQVVNFIVSKVYEIFEIKLEPEVRIYGKEGEINYETCQN